MNAATTSIVPTQKGNECNPTDEESNRSYNLSLHIISIFILLFASLLSASISVVSTRVKALRISPIIINVGKFFGSGIVLATGFIHMLPAAMEALTDPCLPESWNVYGAYAGLFAMLAVLAMQLIEYIAHERYRSVTLPGASPVTNDTTDECDKYDAVPISASTTTQRRSSDAEVCEAAGHQHGVGFQDEAQRHKVSTYLLEFGIALHSVLIGVALGVTTESFIVLLIALSFHQFFEGMALGAQIARVERMSLLSAISMVAFFAVTTPIGIGIGIGIHSQTYNPKSVAALLVNGILDSVSAGILIYVALVNLITAEMGVHASSFHVLKTRMKVLYFVSLYAGAGAMALIGRWA